ncbi:hypothetical protein ACR3LR_03350 [Pantoea eucalypti]
MPPLARTRQAVAVDAAAASAPRLTPGRGQAVAALPMSPVHAT